MARILVITTSYPRRCGDSAGHFVETEVKSLVDEGHEVTVLAAGSGSSPSATAQTVQFVGGDALFDHPGAIVRVKQAPWRLLHLLPATWTIRRHLIRNVYDRIIAHWLIPCAIPWAIFGKAPLEVVVHGSDLRLLLRAPARLQALVIGTLSRRGAQLRFVSAELKTSLLQAPLPQLLLRYVESSHVAPAKISLPSLPSRTEARSSLAIQPGENLVLFVGRLIDQKRPDTAIRAASLIPLSRVCVIGEGPMRFALKRAHPEATFLGQLPRNETLTWLKAADVLICPSRLEGAPTVVREARALSVPVVSAPAGDLRRWAETDKELYLVDPHPSKRQSIAS